jgi:hypothetical protein
VSVCEIFDPSSIKTLKEGLLQSLVGMLAVFVIMFVVVAVADGQPQRI